MKTKILTALMLVTAVAVSTQAQTSKSTNTNASSGSQNGFYAGLEYANLTDVRMQSKFEYFNGIRNVSESNSSTGGTHMGIAGLSFGYLVRNPNASQFNVSGGLRLMQSFNKSEYEDTKITFIIPELNAGYLVTDQFETYAGASLPFVSGSSELDHYETRGGLNLGLAAHINRQLTIKAAYNVFAFHYKLSDPNFSGTLDMAISGLALTTQFNF